MKYYLVAGEASGDLHGSNLIKALRRQDAEAHVRSWGGDLMRAESDEFVSHYKDRAYMGLWEVLTHLRTITGFLKQAEQDILASKPDALILIDNPGFNLRLGAFAKKHGIPVHYYIAPKVWAWNTKRVKKIRRDVDFLYSILPFETEFFAKHGIATTYVGNPTMDAVKDFQPDPNFTKNLGIDKPLIAVLPGSRRNEIERILPTFLKVIPFFKEYQFVVAAAPDFDVDWYQKFEGIDSVIIVKGKTYEVLSVARAALVASGTATLETALFRVPQVVCYRVAGLTYFIGKMVVKLKWFGLVNLILNRELVTELLQDTFTEETLKNELQLILDENQRKKIQLGYAELAETIGDTNASNETAKMVIKNLKK